jgi:hypothetical protein
MIINTPTNNQIATGLEEYAVRFMGCKVIDSTLFFGKPATI